MIKITEVSKPRREPTKKELRNGATKWKLSHLPADADRDAFTKFITPLAKIKAGTLDPWEGLSTAQVQEIVDETYGPGAWAFLCGRQRCGVVWSVLYLLFQPALHLLTEHRLHIAFKAGEMLLRQRQLILLRLVLRKRTHSLQLKLQQLWRFI
jgi:hypothetical protein